jgi:hypothetical protein
MSRSIVRSHVWAVLLPLLLITAGCTGTTIVRTQPPDATVAIGGVPLRGNYFEYGRWIGNEYRLSASAPGYKTKEVVVEVHLGTRAAIITFYSLISIVGAPNVLALPWYGQIDDEITIQLEPEGARP